MNYRLNAIKTVPLHALETKYFEYDEQAYMMTNLCATLKEMQSKSKYKTTIACICLWTDIVCLLGPDTNVIPLDLAESPRFERI